MSVYQNIVNRTPIEKGWSGDQKYCAVTADGTKYLLRISSIDRLERKRREYEKMSEVAQLGIPMCLPVEFGTSEEGAYSIQSWIDGEDAEEKVMAMDVAEQYRYGLDAGRILAKIHTIPAPKDAPSWETRFNAKIDRKIAMYENCELKYENGSDAFLNYLAENRYLLSGRPQSYQTLFDKWVKKLRLVPAWDIRLEWVEDPTWRKTGDFKIDCDDKKAIILLNGANPKQENMEEVLVHELMHLKLYPLDQVTEALITSNFEEGTPGYNFAYHGFFTTLEQTVEELAKCFLLEFGENKDLSFGRCKRMKSFTELYDGLNSIE